MNTKRLIVILLVLSAAFASVMAADPATSGDGTLTPEVALTKAIAIMGLDKDTTWKPPAASKSVTTLTIADDDTPFLHEEINGREVFRVELDRVPVVALKQNTDSVVMRAIRDFQVYLDATTGQLVKIVSTLDSYEGKVKSGEIRFPPPAVAEEQLGSEKYLGLSVVTPSARFLAALAHMTGSPLKSDLIVAQLLDVDTYSRFYRAVWVINTHGVTSFLPHGQDPKLPVPSYQRNHMRTVLDTTGKFLYATNVPYATQ